MPGCTLILIIKTMSASKFYNGQGMSTPMLSCN